MVKKEFRCPLWMTEGLMYQIFPDRFSKSQSYRPPVINKDYILREDWGGTPNHLPDSQGIIKNNDFFGGNLKGIIGKLDYLMELGVTVIYLNPIFEAYSNHRYDTANYKKIDPLLGTEEDFKELCKRSKEKGIRIILDGVFNHTGSDSVYFNKNGRYPEIGAYQSKESPYYSWYKFYDYPHDYESWWGIDTLPHVNETDPGYLDYILNNKDSVVRHWLECGASGFRLDVVDELPDEFLDRFREVVKEYDNDAVIIGEVWEDAATKVSYGQKRRYLEGNQLDSVMNYPLQNGIIDFFNLNIDGGEFALIIEDLHSNYPETVFYGLMNILGTHDTPRILTALSHGVEKNNKDFIRQKLFAAILIWALMPGIPCIYYGDETGMEGSRDPFNRGCFKHDEKDEAIFLHYKKLFAFRKKMQARENLTDMMFIQEDSHGDFYSFSRKGNMTRLLVYVYRNCEEEDVVIELGEGEIIEDIFISGDISLKNHNSFLMKGCSAIALIINQQKKMI